MAKAGAPVIIPSSEITMDGNLARSNDRIFNEKSINKKKKTKCTDRIPSRFVFTFITFVGVCIAYGLRVNINIAIVAMVNSTHLEKSFNRTLAPDNDCPVEVIINQTKRTTPEGPFLWSPTSQGNILGAFYYGYISTQIIGGRLAEFVGPKWLFFSGLLGSSVVSILTPVCARWDEAAVVVVRVVNGLFQGIIYPSMFILVAKWIPSKERSTVLAICLSGAAVGTIIAMPFTAFLCEFGFDGGWPSAFYIYGAIGVVFCVFYIFLVSNSPSEHPRISDTELNYICGGKILDEPQRKARPIPWKKLLTSMPLWAMNVARSCGAFGFHIVLTRIPAYLDNVLHQSVQQNGLMNSVFHLSTVFSMIISGSLADLILHRGYLSKTATRKLFETLSQVIGGACMVGVALVGCDSTAVIVLIAVAMAASGLSSGGTLPLSPEIAPAFTGTVFGIMNSFSASTGFIAPLIVGALLESGEGGGGRIEWSWVFYITAGIYGFGTIFFLVFGSGEAQEWAKEEIPETNQQNGRY